MKAFKFVIVPLLSSIITLLLFYLYKYLTKLYGEAMPKPDEILWALIVGIFTLSLIVTIDRMREIKIYNENITILDKANKTYKSLINAHLNLPVKFDAYLSRQINKYIENKGRGGIVFLNVCNEVYLKWLEDCLDLADKSYEAILTYPFGPDWFFNNDEMLTVQKLKFLEVVNNNRNKKIKVKKRVMIYEREDLKKSFQSTETAGQTQQFFDLNSNVDLYFLDLTELKDTHSSLYENIATAISDDYALIDTSIVLRKSSKKELSVYMGNNEDFKNIFNDDTWNIFKGFFHSKQEIKEIFSLNIQI